MLVPRRRLASPVTPLVTRGGPNCWQALDPILDPVLDKLVQKSGRGLKVVLADKECEYSESFRMYMTCRMGNPHFSPELCAQVQVVNFTVTMGGLEQQLLGRVVQKERYELEEQRQKLVEEVPPAEESNACASSWKPRYGSVSAN